MEEKCRAPEQVVDTTFLLNFNYSSAIPYSNRGRPDKIARPGRGSSQ
jgi:hypothetical protein